MTLTPMMISAMVGSFSAVLTSIISVCIGYKRLKVELLAKHRTELIHKQIEAAEALWRCLEPLSIADGDNRIIFEKDERNVARIQVAKAFYHAVTSLFFSTSGLYWSKNLRRSVFGLRDFLDDKMIKISRGQEEVCISNRTKKSFDYLVIELYKNIRSDIGTTNLQVGKEGPLKCQYAK